MYDEEARQLSIDKSITGSNMWDYEIESGSTYAVDQEVQLKNIQQYIQMYLGSQTPQGNLLDQALEQSGYKFDFGELFKKGMVNSGIQDWDTVLVEQTEEDMAESILERDGQLFEQAMMDMMSGGGQPPGQPPVQQPMAPEQPMM
jgi:fructosamine-3-kinase